MLHKLLTHKHSGASEPLNHLKLASVQILETSDRSRIQVYTLNTRQTGYREHFCFTDECGEKNFFAKMISTFLVYFIFCLNCFQKYFFSKIKKCHVIKQLGHPGISFGENSQILYLF